MSIAVGSAVYAHTIVPHVQTISNHFKKKILNLNIKDNIIQQRTLSW